MKIFLSEDTFSPEWWERAIISGLLTTLFAFLSFPAFAVERGEESPTFTLSTLDTGKSIGLSEYRGKVVLLDFWASWCASCRRTLPWLNTLQTKFSTRGFQVLAINLDNDREDRDRFLSENKLLYPVLLDPAGNTPERFSLKSMPSAFLIDKKGIVRAVFEGYDDNEEGKIEQLIEQLLAEEPHQNHSI